MNQLEYIKDRLNLIRRLSSNWDGHGAKAVPDECCLKCADFLHLLYLIVDESKHNNASVDLIPLPNGGIQIELSKNNMKLEVEMYDKEIFNVLYCEDNNCKEISKCNRQVALSYCLKVYGGST